jgi:hypothetical protein
MRKIYLLLFTLLFSGTVLLASPTSKGGLSVDESQFLFGTQKANVELISQSEMSKTEGKFLPWAFYGAIRWGVSLGYQGYRSYGVFSNSTRITYPLTFGWASSEAW